jgi:hypothetical protein
MHDRRVELLLNELVLREPLLADGKLGTDVSRTLSLQAF